MIEADGKRFVTILAGMAAVFSVELNTPMIEGYWLALRSWSLADFENAAAALMATKKFMPRPADFTDLKLAARATPGEAWAKVLAWLSSGNAMPIEGSWSTMSRVPMGDAAIDRAVAMVGGYYTIGQASFDSLKFIENRFLEHYETSQDIEIARAALSAPDTVPLIGSGQRRGLQSVASLIARKDGKP